MTRWSETEPNIHFFKHLLESGKHLSTFSFTFHYVIYDFFFSPNLLLVNTKAD